MRRTVDVDFRLSLGWGLCAFGLTYLILSSIFKIACAAEIQGLPSLTVPSPAAKEWLILLSVISMLAGVLGGKIKAILEDRNGTS